MPETATLKIFGDIGEEAFSSRHVSDFIDQNKGASTFEVRINSRGGDVQEGWAIHDLLVGSGKHIRTIGEGKIYSIATIVFLAGDEREVMKNADALIHNPFIPPFTLADQYEAGDLEKLATSLRQEEDKIIEFYAYRTGTPIEELSKYMNENTKLSAEDMLRLGFATKIIEPVKAYAYMNFNKSIKMDEKAFFERLGETLDNAIAKMKNFSRLPAVNMTLTDKDGKEFKIEKETGSPAVGDTASPDGTFTMADGKVIIVAEGKITAINEAEPAETELEKALAKIAELEASIANSEKEKPDLVAAEASMKAKEAEAVGLVNELTELKNKWKPDVRGHGFESTEKVGGVDLERVKELNSKLDKSE
jgi:ATP-dependent Clp protease protease subunit